MENPQKLASYGLQTPRAGLEVDGQKLEFGNVAAFQKELIYARGQNQIALISADLLFKTRWSFEQWRDASVMESKVAASTRWALRNGRSTLRFHRIEAGWTVRATENGAPTKADDGVVDQALGALSQAKVTRWLDESGAKAAGFGLKPAQVAFDSGGVRLEIGAKTRGGYAAWRGAGAIFEVPASLFAALNRPLPDWRDRKIARFEPEQVARLLVETGGKRQVLVRNGDQWRREGAPDDLRSHRAALDFLNFAGELRALQFLDSAASRNASFGLKRPILVLQAFDSQGAAALELRCGRVGGRLYAQNPSDADSIFEVDGTALDAIKSAQATLFGPPNAAFNAKRNNSRR